MSKAFLVQPLFHAAGVLVVLVCLYGQADAADTSKQSPGGYGGYGRNATGGVGHRTVEVRTFEELSAALKKGNATIVLKADVDVPANAPREAIETRASNITLDGQGHTIRGDMLPGSGRGTRHILKFTGGKNFILKNFRIRNCNAGGNICFYKGASDIVIDHVSSTGCSNKGITISNGCHDATITHCFLAGNTRSIFIKYEDTTRITIDHCIILKFWIRGPLMSDVPEFDIRNNYIQEWVLFGVGIEGTKSNGNVMGNIFVRPRDSKGPGKTHNAIMLRKSPGKVFIKDNVFRNCKGETRSTTDKPLNTPPIIPAYTTDLARLEKQLLSDTEGAGCMPRDAADKAYLRATKWTVNAQKPFRVPESMPAKPSPR